MNIDFWSSVFKFVGYAGALLVVLSTIATGVVSDMQDAAKDQKIDSLVAGNDKLLKSVEDYKKQIEEKQSQIEDLQRRAANSERGVKRYFTYDGVCKEQNGTRYMTINGPERQVYFVLCQLNKDRNWSALIEQSAVVIGKNKEWLTPYYFRAIGYANIGELRLAEQDLEYVTVRSGDSKDYEDARQLLIKVRALLSGTN